MRQEDAGSECLFGNFLQFPAFRATLRPRNSLPFSAESSWLERVDTAAGRAGWEREKRRIANRVERNQFSLNDQDQANQGGLS
jgi:hypothetical protein